MKLITDYLTSLKELLPVVLIFSILGIVIYCYPSYSVLSISIVIACIVSIILISTVAARSSTAFLYRHKQ
jgi:hypothetical protein